VEARSHIPRLIDHAFPCPVEVCVEVRCIRAQCFAEGKRSGCIVAGMMAVLTNRCTSNPLATDAATGEACGAEELAHCDCASEVAVALGALLRVDIRDLGMGRYIDRRRGSPIQVAHRFYAI
jgi:hypothetical protein